MILLPLHEFMYNKERKSPQTVLVIKKKFWTMWPNVSHLRAVLKALDPVVFQSAIYDKNYSRHSVHQSSDRDINFLFQQNRK